MHNHKNSFVRTAEYTEAEQEALDEIRRGKFTLLQDIQRLKEELAEVNYALETLDIDENGKPNASRRNLQIGKKKFNMDPRKGIDFLVEHALIKHSAEEIARFLLSEDNLMKTAIGDYLGESRCTSPSSLVTDVFCLPFSVRTVEATATSLTRKYASEEPSFL